jgi:tetratricopeptide (TPR) repeat protein
MLYDDFVRKASHAEVLISQGKFRQAETILKGLMATGVDKQDIWRMMIVTWMGMGRYQDARDLCLMSLQHFPIDGWAWYSLAHIYLSQHDYQESLKCIDEALKIEPESDNFHTLQATIYTRLKEYEQALNSADRALEINPENIDAMNNRSSALMALGNTEEAFDLLNKALSSDPENADIHAQMGWTYLQKGISHKALSHFKEALKKSPLDSNALSGMQEALKARFPLYRYFLMLSLKMEQMKSQKQWGIILFFFLVYRGLVYIAGHYPFLNGWITPVIILMLLFFISTWVLSPLMNLYLMTHTYGRWTLSDDQKQSAFFAGISLAISIVSLFLYFILSGSGFLHVCFVAFAWMIPLGSMNNPVYDSHKRKLRFFTLVLLILGLGSSVVSFIQNDFFHLSIWPFLVGTLGYQWYANYLIIQE